MFKQIMISLIEQQASIDLYGIPLTGHFVSYRGSMINWSPIGRNANDDQRKRFVEYDTRKKDTGIWESGETKQSNGLFYKIAR